MTIYFGYSGCKFNLPIYREFGYDRETACWVMCVQNMNWGKIVFEIKPDLFQYQLNICKKKKKKIPYNKKQKTKQQPPPKKKQQ